MAFVSTGSYFPPVSARQACTRGHDGLNSFLAIFSESRKMSHFSAWAWLSFSVKMNFHIAKSSSRSPIRLTIFPQITEQIRHRNRPQQFGRAERQATYGAQLL